MPHTDTTRRYAGQRGGHGAAVCCDHPSTVVWAIDWVIRVLLSPPGNQRGRTAHGIVSRDLSARVQRCTRGHSQANQHMARGRGQPADQGVGAADTGGGSAAYSRAKECGPHTASSQKEIVPAFIGTQSFSHSDQSIIYPQAYGGTALSTFWYIEIWYHCQRLHATLGITVRPCTWINSLRLDTTTARQQQIAVSSIPNNCREIP